MAALSGISFQWLSLSQSKPKQGYKICGQILGRNRQGLTETHGDDVQDAVGDELCGADSYKN